MSSAANAPLSNIRERKQGKLLSYFPAPQQLCGDRSCGKRARKGHFHCHQHTFTHVEPTQATGRPRHTVQSCGAQAGRFLRGAPGRAAGLRRPQLLQPCEKTARRRLNTPASQTGAPIFLSRRQCPRRLPKNQGYKASPRSALSADGEANKGTCSADPPSPNRRSRPGLAQRRARHAHSAAPRKSGSPAGTRRHRGLCLDSGRRRPRATTPKLLSRINGRAKPVHSLQNSLKGETKVQRTRTLLGHARPTRA